MANDDFNIKRRLDGSIDFDAYKADAARERQAVRGRLIFRVALPFLWNAPARLVTKLVRAPTLRRGGMKSTRP